MTDPTDKELLVSHNVINIEEYRFSRKNTRWPSARDECQHLQLTLDGNGEIITCDDCDKQVSAYWSIQRFLDEWARAWERIKRRQQECTDVEKSQLILRAALRVQKAWRRRRTVPICPHCYKAILPDDNFGWSSTNKAMELKRREKEMTVQTEETPRDGQ